MNFSVLDRAKLIAELAQAGMRTRQARKIMSEALKYTPVGDSMEELNSLYNQAVRLVRYTDDPHGYDEVKRFDIAISDGTGDCATMTVVGGTLAGTAGFDVKYKLARPYGIDDFHIYPLVGLPKHNPTEWVPFDTAIRVKPGVEVPHRPDYTILDPDSGQVIRPTVGAVGGETSMGQRADSLITAKWWVLVLAGAALINRFYEGREYLRRRRRMSGPAGDSEEEE